MPILPAIRLYCMEDILYCIVKFALFLFLILYQVIKGMPSGFIKLYQLVHSVLDCIWIGG